ncbi:MAG TPA: hypothetical protein VFJ60_07895 [Gaiella sp.]|nr:hypothetical protein [Gaiella sp.]
MTLLERDGTGVRPDYRHDGKLACAGQSIALGDTLLKWYEIAPADDPIEAPVSDLARLGLADAARLGELRLGDTLGFVILHHCREGFHFLLLCTWQNENELWETVWAKDGDTDPEFHPWPLDGPHRPTFCVWELGVVAHERDAWARFLRSPRDRDARFAYLRDTAGGLV